MIWILLAVMFIALIIMWLLKVSTLSKINCYCTDCNPDLKIQRSQGVSRSFEPFSATLVVHHAIELFGLLIRLPILSDFSRILFGPAFLSLIIITWNYEFFLIAQLLAPETFKPYTNLKDMIDKGLIKDSQFGMRRMTVIILTYR